ncbi:hypothetical protein R6Q59_028671 [Mikania micrantha]
MEITNRCHTSGSGYGGLRTVSNPSPENPKIREETIRCLGLSPFYLDYLDADVSASTAIQKTRCDEVEKPTFCAINERQKSKHPTYNELVDEVETLKETCATMQQILIEKNLMSPLPKTRGPSQDDTSECDENVDE